LSRAGRGPVRPLDQEAEEGLLRGREEHDQRGAFPGEEPGFALRGVRPEGDLDPLPAVAQVIQRPVPDEPVLGPAPAALASGQRDVTARPCLRCGGAGLRLALDHRVGDPGAGSPQPGDVPQEQQGRGLDPAQGGGDLRRRGGRGHGVVVEREDEPGLRGVTVHRIRRGIDPGRPDVVVDPEVLGAAVHPRGLGVGVDRLEADAELPDFRQVPGFPALPDPGDAAHVGLGERPPVVPDFQPVIEELEGQRGRARILGVLDQLEDEVSALAVQVPEQVQHGRVPAVPGDVLVADLLVVRWHPDLRLPARRESAGLPPCCHCVG